MTAAQKKNVARFKQVQAEAKKLKSKNKNLSHLDAVKKAWAIVLHKAPVTKKQHLKKQQRKKQQKKLEP